MKPHEQSQNEDEVTQELEFEDEEISNINDLSNINSKVKITNIANEGLNNEQQFYSTMQTIKKLSDEILSGSVDLNQDL